MHNIDRRQAVSCELLLDAYTCCNTRFFPYIRHLTHLARHNRVNGCYDYAAKSYADAYSKRVFDGCLFRAVRRKLRGKLPKAATLISRSSYVNIIIQIDSHDVLIVCVCYS